MFRLIFYGICFLCGTTALTLPKNIFSQNLNTEIIVFDDISKLKDFEQRNSLISLKSVNVRDSLLYQVGDRVLGDQLVAAGSDSAYYNEPQNVQLQVKYPVNGVGAVISYVAVLVNQSSNEGAGYVMGGGVGERYIDLVIEARNTLFIEYTVNIYGIM